MDKTRKRTICFAILLVAAGLCSPTLYSAYAKEPVYDDQPLSYWLLARPDEAQQNAIRQIGTNAIPTLLKILGAKQRNMRKVAANLQNEGLQQRFQDKDANAEDLRSLAVKGFAVLGTNAQSAIPQMSKLLKDPEIRLQIARALTKIGPTGLTVLTNALAKNKEMRNNLIWSIAQEGGMDPQALIQLLRISLTDPDWTVRGNAADFLAGKDPAIAVPALIPVLDDKSEYPRERAAISLGSYGAASKRAAPKLLEICMNETNITFLEALRKIDRATAGEAESFIVNSGPLNSARIGYTKTPLKNGKELVTGGYISTAVFTPPIRFLSSSELVDPATGKWTETGKMRFARYGHTATLLSTGKVLVAGGSDGQGHDLSSAELYDPDTGEWTATGPLNAPRSGGAAVLLSNGKVLVFLEPYNGPLYSVEQYDPTLNKWTVITNLTHKPM